MKNNTNKVVELLRSYRSKKRMIEQLRFELQNPSQVTAAELLRSMSIGRTEFSTVHSSGISDKTMSVVAHYNDITEKMNIETLDEIKRELRVLLKETEKLEHYVSLLESNHSEVIKLRDFEGKHWCEIETELNTTERRLRARRTAAIEQLAAMYEFVDELMENDQEEE